MTNEESIFCQALAMESPEERAAFLDEACTDDSRLRAEVEMLLKLYEGSGSFLEGSPPGLDRTVDVNREAMDAGLAPAFGTDAAVVVGNTGHSVLKSLSQHLPRTPNVVLRENDDEGDKVAQSSSTEVPRPDSDSRYQLHGEIARGGMGAIIRGRDTDLGRDLAIKVLLDSHKDKPDVMQRFVEEAQIGGQLQHPGIVPVYELGQFGDQRPFFTMKLVKGQTLAALLSKRKQATDDVPKLLGIFEQVCQTMAYAHSKGVIHRDLKPANIMVGAFGEVQVMDWGLAKVLGVGGVEDEQRSLDKHRDVSVIQTRRSTGSDSGGEVGSQTQMGSVMGTPAYMPPEQALGEIDRLDERADVFGLGAILVEILTGKPPYVAEDSTQVFRMASRGKLDDCFARLDNCEAEEDLIRLAKTALSPEPDDRMGDARELATEITRHLEAVQERLKQVELARVEAQTRSEEERRRKKLYLAVAGLMLVLAVAAAAGAVWFNRLAATQTELAAQTQRLADEREVRRLADEQARLAAEGSERRAKVLRLAAQSELIQKKRPVEATLLALEAVAVARGPDGNVLPAAQAALLNSVSDLGGVPLGVHESGLHVATVSPDGRWLMTGSKSPHLWDLTSDDPASTHRTLRGLGSDVHKKIEDAAFSSDSRWLFTSSFDATVVRWDLSSENPSAPLLLRAGRTGSVRLAVSPDGHWLATGSLDGTIRLWDLTSTGLTSAYDELLREDESGRVFLPFPPHRERGINDIAISPDGRWLAAACADNLCRLWDLSNYRPGVEPLSLEGHADQVTVATFGSEGRWLLTGSRDKTARLWDLNASTPGEQNEALGGHADVVSLVAISRNRQWIATCSAASARLWKFDGGEAVLVKTLTGHEEEILDLGISPDSRWLVTASRDHTARIWDLNSEDIENSPAVLRGHDDFVQSIAFTSDGRALITASWDGTARNWDLTAKNPASDWVLRGSPSRVGHTEFTSDGRWLAAATADNEIRLWDFSAGIPTDDPVLLENEGFRWEMSTSPDSRWLAATTGDGGSVLSVWDLRSGNVPASQRRLEGHVGFLWFPTFSPDSQWVASSGRQDRTARIWSITDKDFGRSIVLSHPADVKSIEFSPDQRWFATAATDGAVRLWDFTKLTTTPETTPSLILQMNGSASRQAWYAKFSSDARYLVAFGVGGDGSVWDLRAEDVARTRQRLIGHQNAIIAMGMALDGRSAVTLPWGEGTTPRLWPRVGTDADPAPVKLKGHSNALTSLAVDGDFLATASDDETARIWDLSEENPTQSQLVLRGHSATVYSVAFSPDGQWIVTAGGDRIVRLWDRDIDRAIQRARQLTGRELTPDERERYELE